MMRILARLFLLLCVCPYAPAQSLYAQSIQTALARTTAGVEILVLDLHTHETLADTFASPGKPIPVGSLLKPFLALAFAKTHSEPLPTVVCHGQPDRCWKPGGHGTMTLPTAITNSCNAFFLQVARGVDPASIPYLSAPPHHASPATLIGITADWPIVPTVLAEAYASLLAAPRTPTQAAILEGMRGAAARGTAARIGHHPGAVLAKTGTAPCIDLPCKASGDGLVVAAAPATHPTLLLLVRRRGTTGAIAAASAGRILTQLETLHAE